MKYDGSSRILLAALIQGFVGLCFAGLGFMGAFDAGLANLDIETFWYLVYSVVGVGQIILAIQLARGIPSLPQISLGVFALGPIIPLLQFASQGFVHGLECSLLLLFLALPGGIAGIVLLLAARREWPVEPLDRE